MKNLLAFAFVTLIYSNTSHSQDISGNQDWKSEKDFRNDENKVIKNILWIESNPNIDKDDNKKAVAGYVLKWISDCPYISVSIDAGFLSDIQNSNYPYSSDMTVAFMFGKTLYLIENQNKKSNEVDATIRGIKGMLNTYNSIKKIKGETANNEPLEKFKKMDEEGKLKDYVEKIMKDSK